MDSFFLKSGSLLRLTAGSAGFGAVVTDVDFLCGIGDEMESPSFFLTVRM